MLTIFFRAVILYAFSVFAVRVMGKRQIGQLQPYELVAAILIADLVAEPMSGAETPLLYGVVPVLALVLMHSLFALLGMKSPGFRRMLNGSARVLIQDGSICLHELRQVCMPLSDLMETLRAAGYMSVADVQTAVLETNGVLSVFPRAAERPATSGEQGLHLPEETLPRVLISDGAYREAELQAAGITRASLDAFLKSQGLGDAGQTLLCLLDGKGVLYVQPRQAGSAARRVPWKEAAPCAGA